MVVLLINHFMYIIGETPFLENKLLIIPILGE
jgi:hypothetical protein